MNRSVIFSLAICAAAFIPLVAMAEPTDTSVDFAFRHPARAQVVYRIERIKWIIDQRKRGGDFTSGQALAPPGHVPAYRRRASLELDL